MANWIKALLVLTGVCAVILLLDTTGDILEAALHRLTGAVPATRAGTRASSELWDVVDNPIRSYIAQNTAGLTVSSSAVYTAWQFTGLFGLIGGLIGNTGARITRVVRSTGRRTHRRHRNRRPRLDHRLHPRPSRPEPAPSRQQLPPARPGIPAPDRDPARDPHPRPDHSARRRDPRQHPPAPALTNARSACPARPTKARPTSNGLP